MEAGAEEVEVALPRDLIRRPATPLVALHGVDSVHELLAGRMVKVPPPPD